MTQDEIEARGEFTPRTQGEIDRNLFAARTGALVTLSAGAAWELIYAAQAWHRHVKAPASRTAKDYAIEHAGYLADAARQYREAVNAEIAAEMEIEEDDTPEAQQALEAAVESVGEAGRRLESAIYEFEKRRDRAAFPLAPQARDAKPVETAIGFDDTLRHSMVCREVNSALPVAERSCVCAAQARDTTPSEEA